MTTGYMQYRGKCKEMADDLAAKNGYAVVRGWYHCPFWGRQAHWWCVDSDGTIHDPSKQQFPSAGIGEYEEFSGFFECAECGKSVPENQIIRMGNYACCSHECSMRLVGF